MYRLRQMFMTVLAGCVSMEPAGCVSIERPAETEQQDMVLIYSPTYSNTVELPTEPVFDELITNLLDAVDVGYVVNFPEEADDLDVRLTAAGVDTSGLVPFEVEHTDIWARDNMGVFVRASIPGIASSIAMVDFEFDGWFYAPFSTPEQQEFYEIDNQVAPKLADLMGIPTIYSPLVTEGGAWQSNGQGTLAYALPALTQRNPTWTQETIEHEFRRVLGIDKFLALPTTHLFDGHSVTDGPLYDEDGTALHFPFTVNHADNVVQWVNDDTLLVVQAEQADVRNPLEQQSKDRLDQIWSYLDAEVNQDGEPLNLIAFPDPGLITFEATADDDIYFFLGDLTGLQDYDPNGGTMILAASYMNFVLTNDLVVVPQFAAEGRPERLIQSDAEAISILEEVYYPRQVVGQNVDAVGRGGGGIHCTSQERYTL